MSTIELNKKSRLYNRKYRDIFGYIPCDQDYCCNQDEFYEALVKSVEQKVAIETFVEKKPLNRMYGGNI